MLQLPGVTIGRTQNVQTITTTDQEMSGIPQPSGTEGSPSTSSDNNISHPDDYVDIAMDEWLTIDSIGHGVQPEDVLPSAEEKLNFLDYLMDEQII